MGLEKTNYLPIYDQFFPLNGALGANWQDFQSKEADFTSYQAPVDFSFEDAEYTWSHSIKKVLLVLAKIIIFPWGLYECAKYFTQRLVMIPLYPAQSRIAKFFIKKFNPTVPLYRKELDELRKKRAKNLTQEGFIVRQVTLQKNGTKYSGLLIGRPEHIHNGKWALQATGNLEPIEHTAPEFARSYAHSGFNLLLINGPAVGRSEGEANPQSMGDAQEAGITFLETALKAKKIALIGRSLGGAAIGQAVLKHRFKEGIQYKVIQQMTFDRSSNICGKTMGGSRSYLGSSAKRLVKWSCEMDTVSASRKLSDLNLPEVIIQSTNKDISFKAPGLQDFHTDGPILAKASLGYRLVKENIMGNKRFIGLPMADHMSDEAITATSKELYQMATTF